MSGTDPPAPGRRVKTCLLHSEIQTWHFTGEQNGSLGFMGGWIMTVDGTLCC